MEPRLRGLRRQAIAPGIAVISLVLSTPGSGTGMEGRPSVPWLHAICHFLRVLNEGMLSRGPTRDLGYRAVPVVPGR